MESFKSQAEITRLASNSNLVPSNMREVNRHVCLSQSFDTRSVNNVLNEKCFKLPDILHDNLCIGMIDENRQHVLEVERTGTLLLVRKLETVKAIKKMDKHFSKENVYYPFRMTSWSDNERCRISSFFVSMWDEGCYQATDRSGISGASKLGLVVDDGFFQCFAIRQAQIGLEGAPAQGVFQWREQFDSIAKDFFSGEAGKLVDSLASILPMLQQK